MEVLSVQLEGTEDSQQGCLVHFGGGEAVRDEDREMGPNSVGPCHCGDGGHWETLKDYRQTSGTGRFQL